tara:strand:+ start:519 stop:791 length:273 start_codon:yes stop_codon:yes gene_type:complete
MSESSIEQSDQIERMARRILRLEEALRLVRDVAEVSEGVEWYEMVSSLALKDTEAIDNLLSDVKRTGKKIIDIENRFKTDKKDGDSDEQK